MLPAALQGLSRSEMKRRINEAPLGKDDREIARLRYVDLLCLEDIAVRVHYCRQSVSNHLDGIAKILE